MQPKPLDKPPGWSTAAFVFTGIVLPTICLAFAMISMAQSWRFSLAQLLGVVTWLAIYMGAWRISWQWVLEEYEKLPK